MGIPRYVYTIWSRVLALNLDHQSCKKTIALTDIILHNSGNITSPLYSSDTTQGTGEQLSSIVNWLFGPLDLALGPRAIWISFFCCLLLDCKLISNQFQFLFDLTTNFILFKNTKWQHYIIFYFLMFFHISNLIAHLITLTKLLCVCRDL